MSNYLWKFDLYCGRSGDLDGLFVATELEVAEVIGKCAYFGEVLGKHSEVAGTLKETDIKKLDLDSETVEKVSKILGKTWSGFNPLHYIQYTCDKCETDYHSDEMHEITSESKICNYCKD